MRPLSTIRNLGWGMVLILIWSMIGIDPVMAQSGFDPAAYQLYLKQCENLSGEDLRQQFKPVSPLYNSTDDTSLSRYLFLDSVEHYYRLTQAEQDVLKRHHFVVTERCNRDDFGSMLFEIYGRDLPVFVSTDMVLNALHLNFDQIMKNVEIYALEPWLRESLSGLRTAFPAIYNRYRSENGLALPLQDVDLYLTITQSLLNGDLGLTVTGIDSTARSLWDAIQSEKYIEMPLFSETFRELDFSQFTVRGHYDCDELRNYFKAMMWLGRIDFFLTRPPSLNPTAWQKEEIRRMNISAALLDELIREAGVADRLHQIDELLSLMAGQSDNLTVAEYRTFLDSTGITKPTDLMNDGVYDPYLENLARYPLSGQKILSSIFRSDINDPTSIDLPVSYRLMGQRFTLDSYVFTNVVYDRIHYQGQKVWRPMPDPLDAMFALGNNNVGELIRDDLERYHYAGPLAAMRYLVDSYDPDFWSANIYHHWLQSIRQLNQPLTHYDNLPYLFKTTAWQQEKLNTQLASWAQLRHDFLLYAKQSYTGGTSCSFPHSYVEPYPEFYRDMADFTRGAAKNFATLQGEGFGFQWVPVYFDRFAEIMDTLAGLADKEINRQEFDEGETAFLKRMLFKSAESGAPPFSGWFGDLYYSSMFYSITQYTDWVVADVHTQPTDQGGAIVGNVMHVATGPVNLGIFLAEAPSLNYQPMVFVGPVMSYYQFETTNFKRFTDQEWQDSLLNNRIPERPDWVNLYLTDAKGNARIQGRELEGSFLASLDESPFPGLKENFVLCPNYPNPFNPTTEIPFYLAESQPIRLVIYDLLGQHIITLGDKSYSPGYHSLRWNGRDRNGNEVAGGIYFYQMVTKSGRQVRRMLMLK